MRISWVFRLAQQRAERVFHPLSKESAMSLRRPVSRPQTRRLASLTLCLGLAPLAAAPALATIPYVPVPYAPVAIGPGIMPPPTVFGKEYSHDFDTTTSPGGAPDPEQVVLWDGLGGATDGVDFSFTRPNWEREDQVDAIANQHDALFDPLLRDEAHLVFSHDDEIAGRSPLGGFGPTPVPPAGPLLLSNGMTIGGTGELSHEMAGVFSPPSSQGVWAKQPEVNGMPLPKDVDGAELWGPEPDIELGGLGDTNKYSLDTDAASGASVWNLSGTNYLPHALVTSAVETLLGPIPATAFALFDDRQGPQAINLDAMMVSERVGDSDRFDFRGAHDEGLRVNPEGIIKTEGDAILFSISQIIDPADPDGYYSTGSELFVMDSVGVVGFLRHGGHLWDHGYALGALRLVGENGEETETVIDINALEAVADHGEAPVLTGDYNLNGVVDAADFTVWRDSMGATGLGLAADGNFDMVVDAVDYAIWRSNFGMTVPSPATSMAVPEPAAAGLLLAAVAGVLARRRSAC
ncbi:hypothetical protein Mal64_12770 [Pseudobythopirellula maris]|uniref:PEP-CTERM protein-sorting domain-containing protein n=1 Tax=Pseudobythopirellula maris TaxID=2527991 RepID=A0A5C5ZTX2_9BACT|nr:PEP-CTERM sorting domain-containing protein [Pseudobythopirellula maris]TWT90879.1 hypothetical protein Mal64_12770 [Pseudobythopirellula maris]